MYLLVRLETGASLPGLIAATILAVSHTFWRHACIAETYTLWSALFTAELLFLFLYLRNNKTGALLGAALCSGLAFSVHVLASLALLVYLGILLVLCMLRRLRVVDLLKVSGVWMLGALPILFLVGRQLVDTGDVQGTLQSLFFGKHWQGAVLNTAVTPGIVRDSLLYIGLNFPSPLLVLVLLGWGMAVGTRRLHLLCLLGLVYFIFAFRYTVPDRYAFFIPFYVLTALATGRAVHWLLGRTRERGLRAAMILASLLPVGVYGLLPPALEALDLKLPTRGDVPFRHDPSYFLTPWKMHDQGARRFAVRALDAVGPEAVVFADLTTAPPLLLLQQLETYRTDVHIVSAVAASPQSPPFNQASLADLVAQRPVYVVSRQPGYCPDFVLAHFDLVRSGVLWRVMPRGEMSG